MKKEVYIVAQSVFPLTPKQLVLLLNGVCFLFRSSILCKPKQLVFTVSLLFPAATTSVLWSATRIVLSF